MGGAKIRLCKELFLSSLFCPSDAVTIPALGSSYLQNCSFVTSGPSECSHHAFLQGKCIDGTWPLESACYSAIRSPKQKSGFNSDC